MRTQRVLRRGQLGGVALVELGRGVELFVAADRCVGAQADDPGAPVAGAPESASAGPMWVGWAQLTMK
jgi:hypothetical protein